MGEIRPSLYEVWREASIRPDTAARNPELMIYLMRKIEEVRKSSRQASLNIGDGKMSFTAVFLKAPEGYVGFVEELPGANTQGATLDEARKNLKEAVRLVLQANREMSEKGISRRRVIREKIEVPLR
jgi:predicted RNase H-like HicB family nuclease